MKKKIFEALKTEYASLGLSDNSLNRIASFLEGSVEKEDDIATAVKRDDVKLLATSIQGEIDGIKRAKDAAEAALADYKAKHPETDVKEPPKNTDEEPAWAKTIREQNERILRMREDDDKKAKQKATIASAIAAAKKAGCTDERVLKLTEKLFTTKDDESDDDAGKRFEAEYNANAKEYFGESVTPFRSTGAPITSDEQMHNLLGSFADGKFGKQEPNK